MKRPKPFAVGKVRVRVHSGPRDDGRWRWRADRPAGTRAGRDVRTAVWSGWATAEEAEATVIELLAARGEDFHGPADLRTVFDLLDVWTGELGAVDRSVATTRARRSAAQRIARSPLGGVALAQLARPATGLQAIERYVRAYQGARSTCRADLIALYAAWRWGRARELVPDTELPRVSVSVDQWRDAVRTRYTPTDVEVLAVLDRIRTRRTRPRDWPWRALLLLWATGCRPGEIATLTWDRVEGQLLHVDGKTGRRTVAVHSTIAAEIASWEHTAATVHGAKPASVLGYLHVLLERACAEAGVERWSLYGLRRAAVDRLYRRDQDPSVSAAAMGHSARMAIETYRRVTTEDLVAVAEAVGLGVAVPDNVVTLSGRPVRTGQKGS